MIRLTLLWFVVGALAFYAWKDWYKSLCGLVLLMAVVEHPDMPKSLFGVQGLSPWNILLLVVVVAWFTNRSAEGRSWDMPRGVGWLLLINGAVVLLGFFRMLADWNALNDLPAVAGLAGVSKGGVWSEYFINTFKWVIPGLLMFDGCRSRRRFTLGLFSVLAVYFLLAVQVIKWMPLSTVTSGADLTERSLKILSNEVGYHRVNLSMMLAGASWAIFATYTLRSGKAVGRLTLFAGALVCLGQALTGGRMGYLTWAAVGAVLGVVRWRSLLLAMPLLGLGVLLLVPAARERLLQGFSAESVDVNERIDDTLLADERGPHWYTVTAGRNVAWPWVIEQIKVRPWLGHGREAMQRTGVSSRLFLEYGELFPHPHNAYLQWIIDNGFLGLVFVLWLFLVLLNRSLSLFRDGSGRVFSATGGVATSLLVALLVAAVGSQTFYPREGSVGMWCAVGLMLRVSVQRERLRAAGAEPSELFERGGEA